MRRDRRARPAHSRDIAIAVGVGRAVDLDAFCNTIDHPVLGDSGGGVELQLRRAIVGQGALRDLDEQERVARVALTLL